MKYPSEQEAEESFIEDQVRLASEQVQKGASFSTIYRELRTSGINSDAAHTITSRAFGPPILEFLEREIESATVTAISRRVVLLRISRQRFKELAEYNIKHNVSPLGDLYFKETKITMDDSLSRNETYLIAVKDDME